MTSNEPLLSAIVRTSSAVKTPAGKRQAILYHPNTAAAAAMLRYSVAIAISRKPSHEKDHAGAPVIREGLDEVFVTALEVRTSFLTSAAVA